MTEPHPRLVLIGPPGAGKTRVGKRVARRLHTGFVDTDKAIVAEHGPISEIFAQHGEPHFRALERVAVEAALKTPGIVTLGGGAILDPRTQADLADRPVVLLTVTPEAVADRITGEKRPLLAAGGVGAWKALVEQRMPIYTSLASARFDTSGIPMDRVADRVVEWLLKEPA